MYDFAEDGVNKFVTAPWVADTRCFYLKKRHCSEESEIPASLVTSDGSIFSAAPLVFSYLRLTKMY